MGPRRLAQRFYPSGRRRLLKLWWEGAGTMSVRSDRFQLFFRSGTGTETTVRAPIEPIGLDAYRALLERTLPGLKGAIVEPTNLDYVLPPGGTFADLLMLGGASRLLPDGERPVARAGRVERLHQVFRNWNLERRRVNEWRMIVSGGAFSEKGLHPEGRDSMMPVDTPEAWTSPLFNHGARGPFDEGEATARQLGWVPLLRKWLDVAARPGQSALADERFNPNDPPPHALSRGLAYLLDMPDPVVPAP